MNIILNSTRFLSTYAFNGVIESIVYTRLKNLDLLHDNLVLYRVFIECVALKLIYFLS